MFTKEQKTILEEMNRNFKKIEELFNRFDNTTQEYILNYHIEEGSIPHCVRWGLNGTEELLEEETVFEEGTKFKTKSDIELEGGYIPKGTTVTLSQIDFRELLEYDSEPFQLEFDGFHSYDKELDSDGYYQEVNLNFIKKYLELFSVPSKE